MANKCSEDPLLQMPPFRSLLDAITDSIAVLDPSGRIRWVNGEWRRFALDNGADVADLGMGLPYQDFFGSDAEAGHLREGLRAVLDGRRGQVRQQYPCHSPDARRWFELVCAAVPEAPGWVVVSHRDVTERVLLEEEVRHAADHDRLTGLANRRSLRRHAEKAIGTADQAGHEVAIFCIDLDRLDDVNETLGRSAGDRVLETVAIRLRAACRDADLVTRSAGDEFVVVAEAVGRKESRGICRRIRLGIEAPVDLSEGQARIGASIGFALYPTHGSTFQAVLREADEAMHADKQRRLDNVASFRLSASLPEHDALSAGAAS